MNDVSSTPMASLCLELAGEQVALLAGRGLWWPGERTLFIADPHFGKAATFRLSGIPVPESTHEADLERLSLLLKGTGARRLVVLGDFFHAKLGCNESTHAALQRWRERWAALEITLVIGNHDRHAGPPAASLGIQTVEGPCLLAPFAACHEPRAVAGHFALAGHLHPACRVASATVPCFHRSEVSMVFPAFGSFTGTSRVKPAAGDRIYLTGPHEVIALPASSLGRPSKS